MADENGDAETEALLRLSVDDWKRLLRDMAGHLVGWHSWQRTLVVELEGQLREARALAARVEAKLSAQEPRPTYREVFDQVHKAGGHVWDDIADPGKFLNEECR